MRPSLSEGLRSLPRTPQAAKRWLSIGSSLEKLGWTRSVREGAPVDRVGQPLPWYSYPALLWLGPRLWPGAHVFEYGAGNSTRWFERLGSTVTAVEHDPVWADYVRGLVERDETTILHVPCAGDAVRAPDGDRYTEALRTVEVDLDVIAVDGRARLSCLEVAFEIAQSETLIILDNSDRSSLQPALAMARDRGAQRIDFTGPVPGSGRLSTTTVMGRNLSRWLMASPPLEPVGYD